MGATNGTLQQAEQFGRVQREEATKHLLQLTIQLDEEIGDTRLLKPSFNVPPSEVCPGERTMGSALSRLHRSIASQEESSVMG